MRFILCLSILLTATFAADKPQRSADLERKSSAILTRMASTDLKTREAALDDLLGMTNGDLAGFLARHPGDADRIKLSLIHLLSADNDQFMHHNPNANYTEEDMEHWAQVVTIVAALDDDRAIPALVGAMTTGGIAGAGVYKYGQKALGAVTDRLNDPDPTMRSCAVEMAVVLLLLSDDNAAHARILGIIRSALTDPVHIVRMNAIGSIERLKDRELLVPMLQDAATHDPKRVRTPDGRDIFPVRNEANRVLNNIARNAPMPVVRRDATGVRQ